METKDCVEMSSRSWEGWDGRLRLMSPSFRHLDCRVPAGPAIAAAPHSNSWRSRKRRDDCSVVCGGDVRNDAVRAWQHGRSTQQSSLTPSRDSIVSGVWFLTMYVYVPVVVVVVAVVVISRDEWSVWPRCFTQASRRVQKRVSALPWSGVSDGVCNHVEEEWVCLTGARQRLVGYLPLGLGRRDIPARSREGRWKMDAESPY